MRPRRAKDIWQGLYDFHLLETPEDQDTVSLMEQAFTYKTNRSGITLRNESKLYRHKLTHQHIHARFFHLELHDRKGFNELSARFGMNWYSHDEVRDLPKPILIDNYLKEAIF